MNTKTMEGLVGARTNMNLMNTPMRVYKEARRKGDTAAMERAMGYAGEFSDKAEEYKTKADRGMKEDAEEAREKVESECEEAVLKRKEEREKQEEKMAESRSGDAGTDTLEISEEGKVLAKDNIKTDAVKAPVTYTKTGEAVHTEQGAGISVSV